jgi:hypothetical protein
MRRTLLLALLAALLLAPAAHASDPLKDCQDSVLQGDYTVAELRKALNNMPSDLDEYSDCRDVLSRAISAKAASKSPTPAPTPDRDSGAGGGGSTPTPSPSPSPTPNAEEQERAKILAAPSSPEDARAVGSAASDGDAAIKAELAERDPGAWRLAASVGRNDVPTTMIAVLVMLAATFVVAGLPLLRRRRDLPRPPA